jgi:hypothetical protein
VGDLRETSCRKECEDIPADRVQIAADEEAQKRTGEGDLARFGCRVRPPLDCRVVFLSSGCLYHIGNLTFWLRRFMKKRESQLRKKRRMQSQHGTVRPQQI